MGGKDIEDKKPSKLLNIRDRNHRANTTTHSKKSWGRSRKKGEKAAAETRFTKERKNQPGSRKWAQASMLGGFKAEKRKRSCLENSPTPNMTKKRWKAKTDVADGIVDLRRETKKGEIDLPGFLEEQQKTNQRAKPMHGKRDLKELGFGRERDRVEGWKNFQLGKGPTKKQSKKAAQQPKDQNEGDEAGGLL